MYRLMFRKIGAQAWSEGAMFPDEAMTEDAREMLTERHARQGMETRLERVPASDGDEE